MKLLRFRQGGRDCLGLLLGEDVLDLNGARSYQARQGERPDRPPLPEFPGDLPQLFARPGWQQTLAAAAAYAEEWQREQQQRPPFVLPLAALSLLPPLGRPGKLLCVGLNYPAAGEERSAAPPYPVLFHKAASAIIGSGSAIRLPRISSHVLYEGELAVVIGQRAQKVRPEEALEVVAGYTIANDVGARDVEQRTSQWTSGKMFDTFCPLGPLLVTADELPDPSQLHIQTTVNGEVVQDAPTGSMFYDVPALISYISTLTTLEPGDLILTGSPKTVAGRPDPRRSLRPGDLVAITILPIGVLDNPVVDE